MRGELVVVRAYGDEPLVRRVWDVNQWAVFICTEENYQNLLSNREALNPVGFPKEDVFQYDDAARDWLERLENDRSLWEHLTVWNGQAYIRTENHD